MACCLKMTGSAYSTCSTLPLYQETLTEAYLLGKVPRETVLRELGFERLAEIDYQRDALRRDVAWGPKGV